MSEPPTAPFKPRRPLFWKYFAVLFVAVVVPLLIGELSSAWFSYRDERAAMSLRLKAEAKTAAAKSEAFLDNIRNQLEWTVEMSWAAGSEQRHRLDVLRMLLRAPAVTDVTEVDGKGIERLRISRVYPDVIDSGIDHSHDRAFLGARARRVWYGPVTLHDGSEPYMKIAVAGNRPSVGITIADINLKLIWDVISAIHIGRTGDAFILDSTGGLIAHPDLNLVLRGNDPASMAVLRRLRAATRAANGNAAIARDLEGRTVLVATAAIPGPGWTAYVEEPVAEAFAPIRAALWRTGFLLLAGAAFAALLAFGLARRMVGPIRLLEEGAARIGAGQFDQQIEIASGDELEGLARRVNQMAGELALSQERSERIARLKRFLAPQVADLVEQSGQDNMLDGRRAEVVVVFCDLRNFTAFSAKAEPEEIMSVLAEYYEALGAVIMRFEATLTCFSGDGLMLLLNAPVPCPDQPTLRGVRMAIELQNAVQSLIVGWRARGHAIGFGVGLARGEATVGRIGYEGRQDYTAIGSVTNLASRLCAAALDGQILIDIGTAADIRETVSIAALGTRALKGFEREVSVFAVDRGGQPGEAFAAE
ncbi:MAG: cache domain-containing protein [Stellaceae bacterium]